MNRIMLIFCVCFTNGEDMVLQRQIWSTYVTVLWLCKTEMQDSQDIGYCESLVNYDFQNLLIILAQFLQILSLKAVQFFISLG